MAPTRRRVLAATATGIAALAGCSGGSNDGPTGISLTAVPLNTDWDVDVSLDVAFDYATRRQIQPGDTEMVAEEKYKFVLVRMDVTNVGEDTRELTANQYVIQARGGLRRGTQYDVREFEEHYLGGQTAQPDETVTGWVAFHIPEEVDDGVLRAVQNHLTVGMDVTFTHDTSLDVSFPD